MSDLPRLFALPPGVDFPRELAAGLLKDMQGQPPEALARVTLYLNSGRMLRRVRNAFLLAGAHYLPCLRLISDLGRDPLAGLAMAVSPLQRKLELARLVAKMAEAEPGFDSENSHFALAESLNTLMAEMQTEAVHPDDLEQIEIAETHAEHWQKSLKFIRIVARYFNEDAALDAQARQRRAVEDITARWAAAPPKDPVIVAGSTGSHGATAAFIRAVLGLENGSVVLPGFDWQMTDAAWNSLHAGRFPIEDHPQYRYFALVKALGLAPSDIRKWGGREDPQPARNRVISLALRPAPVTDQWRVEGAGLGDLNDACKDMTLIEAKDPRQEALAVALVLREAAERGKTAALVTPDRLLARRVSVALDRWDIIPDDSAGQPLQQTAPGRLLRHVARFSGRRLGLADLLILLKHPLTATGAGAERRGLHLKLTRDLELQLRRKGPAFPQPEDLRKWAIGKEERQPWANWVGDLIGRLSQVTTLPLSACVEGHVGLSEAIAAGTGGDVAQSGLWRVTGGRECRSLMEELHREARHGADMSPAAYADLINRHLQSSLVRTISGVHPLISIRGTLEARAQDADLVICGGLNEGSWPEGAAPDPWMSREMRQQAGLLLPERRIGLSAHDFQQAVAAPEIVLSRARRDAEAATVPSRWLNRLTNLIRGLPDQNGRVAHERMIARGERWLHLAETLERPRQDLPPARRPSPRPPVGARPRDLSVTQVQTLIRDPYAIYACKVLRLHPLESLRPEPDPRLRGQILHSIVERFVRERPGTEEPEAAQARLLKVADDILQADLPWPSAQRIWRARIAAIARKFCMDEAERLARATPAVIEKKGSVQLQGVNFRLSAKPDRLDILQDGRVRIYDYKTGRPPSQATILNFDKQMLLEAAMVERGAFGDLGPREVAGMTYIQLGGEGMTRDVKEEGETPEAAWTRFTRLVARYLSPSQGFTARRAMQKSGDKSDYDQLSRYGEWNITDQPDAEDLA